jgi:hypothetical protein
VLGYPEVLRGAGRVGEMVPMAWARTASWLELRPERRFHQRLKSVSTYQLKYLRRLLGLSHAASNITLVSNGMQLSIAKSVIAV